MGHFNLVIGIRIMINKKNLRFKQKKDDIH